MSSSEESIEARVVRLEERLKQLDSSSSSMSWLVGLAYVGLFVSTVLAFLCLMLINQLREIIAVQGSMIQTLTDVVLPR